MKLALIARKFLILENNNLSTALSDIQNLGIPHPFMPGSIWIDEYSITLDVRIWDGKIWLSNILTNESERGKGYASKVLDSIIEIANKYKVELSLVPKPFGSKKSLTKSNLIAWYKRHGFKPIRNDDMMIYSPSTKLESILKEITSDIPKILYHATSYENLGSILRKGLSVDNTEKAIFFTDDPKSSAKFMLVRGIYNIIAIPVKLSSLDKNKIKESFDHSESFFKTRAWIYTDNIPPSKLMVNKILHWNLK